MRKVAIYVEGMTELVFVYHAILAYYQYDWTALSLDFVCENPSDIINLTRPYGNEDADNQFLIYNCGSDERVLPAMLEHFQSHISQGFNSVVGLRDIYGSRYFDIYHAGREIIEKSKVNAMIEDLEKTVAREDSLGVMHICFAIMEIESWLLAMTKLLEKAYPCSSMQEVALVDPEITYLHPFKQLHDMTSYDKHFDKVEKLCSRITSKDIDDLLKSKKCASFERFYNCLFD